MSYITTQWLGGKPTVIEVLDAIKQHEQFSKQDPKPLYDLLESLLTGKEITKK